jgi:vacuolar-type H+-ATPase subunit I/STV1
MLFETEIKTALRNAGLSEDLFGRIKVKNSADIEGAIQRLQKDIAVEKIVKEAGLDDDFKRYVQSETDRRVTEAIQTHSTKIRKEIEDELAKKSDKKTEESADDKKKQAEDSEKEKQMTEEQKELQALRDTIKSLDEKLNGLTTKLTQSEMNNLIREELGKAGLSEEFAAYVNVDDQSKIAEAVSDFKAKLDTHQQGIIDKKLEAGELSSVKKGSPGATLEESQIAAYAKSLDAKGSLKSTDFPGRISSEAESTLVKE